MGHHKIPPPASKAAFLRQLDQVDAEFVDFIMQDMQENPVLVRLLTELSLIGIKMGDDPKDSIGKFMDKLISNPETWEYVCRGWMLFWAHVSKTISEIQELEDDGKEADSSPEPKDGG
jgi:hypothetical protein